MVNALFKTPLLACCGLIFIVLLFPVGENVRAIENLMLKAPSSSSSEMLEESIKTLNNFGTNPTVNEDLKKEDIDSNNQEFNDFSRSDLQTAESEILASTPSFKPDNNLADGTQQQIDPTAKPIAQVIENGGPLTLGTVEDALKNKDVLHEHKHHITERNYAAKDCGAKVLFANEELENRGAILNDPERDDYMRNPCKTENKFLIIELCEGIQLTAIELANFELFSSNLKDFRLYGSERYPNQEWTPLGEFQAQDLRRIQRFQVPEKAIYAKFLKIDLLTHYGNEHYCTLSTVRVYGISMIDEYEAEAISQNSNMNSNSHFQHENTLQNREVEEDASLRGSLEANSSNRPSQGTSSSSSPSDECPNNIDLGSQDDAMKDVCDGENREDSEEKTGQKKLPPLDNSSLNLEQDQLHRDDPSGKEAALENQNMSYYYYEMSNDKAEAKNGSSGGGDLSGDPHEETSDPFFKPLIESVLDTDLGILKATRNVLEPIFAGNKKRFSTEPKELPANVPKNAIYSCKNRHIPLLAAIHPQNFSPKSAHFELIFCGSFPQQSLVELIPESIVTTTIPPVPPKILLPEVKQKTNQKKNNLQFIKLPTKAQTLFLRRILALKTCSMEKQAKKLPILTGKEIPPEKQPINQVQQNKSGEVPPPTGAEKVLPKVVDKGSSPLPASNTAHKETVFMKLNKRLSQLEMTQSLSSEFLQDLSRRYMTQTNEIERQNKRIAETSENLQETNRQIAQLFKQMDAIKSELAFFRRLLMKWDAHARNAANGGQRGLPPRPYFNGGGIMEGEGLYPTSVCPLNGAGGANDRPVHSSTDPFEEDHFHHFNSDDEEDNEMSGQRSTLPPSLPRTTPPYLQLPHIGAGGDGEEDGKQWGANIIEQFQWKFWQLVGAVLLAQLAISYGTKALKFLFLYAWRRVWRKSEEVEGCQRLSLTPPENASLEQFSTINNNKPNSSSNPVSPNHRPTLNFSNGTL